MFTYIIFNLVVLFFVGGEGVGGKFHFENLINIMHHLFRRL